MPGLIVLMLIAVVVFLIYRVKGWRIPQSYRKHWTIIKSHIGLGIFVTVFGINQSIMNPTAVTLTIAILLIAYGCYYTYYSIKQYRQILPYVAHELESNNDQ
ncbi:YtpI family protein [Tuberibacillus sp. Marseille-P3662]|uniref:YtpI family protein n=1 Tax=Tuberibacillus sp. Marseille-P3662 TaxID=1965358 RepID=UPI001594D886|nr:YtpI family protein [Tuberibacillus sp. Marseille-P3662]